MAFPFGLIAPFSCYARGAHQAEPLCYARGWSAIRECVPIRRVGSNANLTISKRGPGVSVGPRGLKVSSRGRLSASKGGFRFTKKLF